MSKSFDGRLQDFDITSSSSSTLGMNDDHAINCSERYDVFGRLLGQMRGMRSTSKSYDSILSHQRSSRNSHSDGELTEQDISQVDTFFRSHKTWVFVCRCLANLYFASSSATGEGCCWELAVTGVPVLLLDRGETRARSQRMLQIVLAERGSGFVLWRDVINSRTNYRAQDATFHVMFACGDRSRTAGLRFDTMSAAMEFFEKVEQLVGDPLNINPSMTKKRSNVKTKQEKSRLPRKCDISQPCCFQHVTNVAIDDKDRLYSLATLVRKNKGER